MSNNVGSVKSFLSKSALSIISELSLLFVIQRFSVRPYLYFGLFSVGRDLRFIGHQLILFPNLNLLNGNFNG